LRFKQELQVLPDLPSITEAEGSRYYRLPSGDLAPSITTILGSFESAELQRWRDAVGEEESRRISGQAKERGSAVHKMIEDHINGKALDRNDYMPDEWWIYKKFEFEVLQYITHIWYMEQSLYSTTLKVAGRCDLICTHQFYGDVIIDWKTSNDPFKQWDKHFEQATCYSLMLEEVTGYQFENFIICSASMMNNGSFQATYSGRDKYINSLKTKIGIYHQRYPSLC
jgi:hypothetical protein